MYSLTFLAIRLSNCMHQSFTNQTIFYYYYIHTTHPGFLYLHLLFSIKDGLIRDYSGGRTTDDLVKYVESDYQSVQPKSIPSWAFIFL